MALNPFLPVENPYPAVGRFGLVRSANLINPEDVHWGGGISWPVDPCAGAGAAVDPFDITNSVLADSTDDPTPLFDRPFLCWEFDRVSTIDQVTDLKAKVARRLSRSTSKQVESEFWLGTRSVALAAAAPTTYGTANLHLADNTNTTKLNGSSATPFVAALGWLQQWACDHYDGSPVMIHAPVTVVNQWTSEHLMYTEPNGGLIYDALGNIIVPGTGYNGVGPDGSGTTTSTPWAYVTGLVSLRLSPVDTEVPGGYIDRLTNTRQHWATRLAAISVDSCRAGIKVDLTTVR